MRAEQVAEPGQSQPGASWQKANGLEKLPLVKTKWFAGA